MLETFPSRDIKGPGTRGGPPIGVSVLISLLGKVCTSELACGPPSPLAVGLLMSLLAKVPGYEPAVFGAFPGQKNAACAHHTGWVGQGSTTGARTVPGGGALVFGVHNCWETVYTFGLCRTSVF